MRLALCLLVVSLAWLVYRWINACGDPLAFGSILPFARTGHPAEYNYAAILMIAGTVWGIGLVLRKKQD